MNALLAAMRRSLAELDLGLKVDLTMTEPMERLMTALAGDAVPPSWALLAYPSLRPLGAWMVNLLARVAQLAEWTADLVVPKSVWLPGARRALMSAARRPPGRPEASPGRAPRAGLFNPQSFLTAVMQTTARRNDWPLDKTVVRAAAARPPRAAAPERARPAPGSYNQTHPGPGAADRDGGHEADAGAGRRALARRRVCARADAGGRALGRQGRPARRRAAQGALLPAAGAPRAGRGGAGRSAGGRGATRAPRRRSCSSAR